MSTETDFWITCVANGKARKIYFRAASAAEREQWVIAFRKGSGREEGPLPDVLLQLSSKLYIEEQSIESVMQSFEGIDGMLK